MSTIDCGLIVFLRLPEKGKVKTRIAATLGEDAALAIYRQLSKHTLKLVSKQIRLPVYLFYEGGIPENHEQYVSMIYTHQCQGSLSEKMVDAFKWVLEEHSKAIIIGSDCPYLSTPDIQNAVTFLYKHDLVLGPTSDGGYYLLGCKKLIPALFEDIDWSTSHVLSQTIEKAKKQKLSYHLLRTLDDIDSEEDWILYQQRKKRKVK